MGALVVATILAFPCYAAANNSLPGRVRRWAIFQVAGSALFGAAGVVGAIANDIPALRIAFILLAAASVVRLAFLPKQMRTLESRAA